MTGKYLGFVTGRKILLQSACRAGQLGVDRVAMGVASFRVV